MKIAITTAQIAFLRGGAELCAEELRAALVRAGHEAEIITMPFIDSPPEFLTNHIAAARLMNISHSWGGKIDLCIGLKFPACFMPHENKVLWMLHQHRAAYDLFNTDFSNIKNDAEGRALRNAIVRADNTYLPEAKRIYTISQNVSNRLAHYNKIPSQPLYQPCPGMHHFYAGEYEDYILMPSRINITKRQYLALEALQHCKQNVKLYIMGRADNEAGAAAFRARIAELRLEKQVKYFDYVQEEEKYALYAGARGVLFIPVDEDYGYITLEAMAAERAVITAADSGGPLEFVQDGKTGLVAQPTPESVAEAMDELWKNKAMAREYGQAGKRRLQEMGISWEHVVKELTKP